MSRIDDVKEAIEVVSKIVDGVKEVKAGGFKTADNVDGTEVQAIDENTVALSDEFIAQKIFETWQSIEVTHRSIAKGGGSSGGSGLTKESILGFIKEKGFAYVDGFAKFRKVPQADVQKLFDELVNEKKIYRHKEKGYYKISTYGN